MRDIVGCACAVIVLILWAAVFALVMLACAAYLTLAHFGRYLLAALAVLAAVGAVVWRW